MHWQLLVSENNKPRPTSNFVMLFPRSLLGGWSRGTRDAGEWHPDGAQTTLLCTHNRGSQEPMTRQGLSTKLLVKADPLRTLEKPRHLPCRLSPLD